MMEDVRDRCIILRYLYLIAGSIMLYHAAKNMIFLVFYYTQPNIGTMDGVIVTYVIDINSMWVGFLFQMVGGLLLIYAFLKFGANKTFRYTGFFGDLVLVGIFVYQLYLIINGSFPGSHHPLYVREVGGGLLLGSMGVIFLPFHFYCTRRLS